MKKACPKFPRALLVCSMRLSRIFQRLKGRFSSKKCFRGGLQAQEKRGYKLVILSSVFIAMADISPCFSRACHETAMNY